ncbi:hypothetical protein AARAC_008495 [Aspergillus arachidicola]|uniref:Uncharacterized protein n=1 Tax=Aspergillus arachidicola TaxID=656916 RepID=A0A2G7FTR0_9EURO|nr:hypothetical protein AARAC_008495 [Aspergillus arachidicola]
MIQLGDILACAKRIMHVWMRWEGVLLQVAGHDLGAFSYYSSMYLCPYNGKTFRLLVKCRNGIILPQDLINLALACVTFLHVRDIGVSEL